MSNTVDIQQIVKEKYGQAAARVQSGKTSCCGGGSALTASCDPITSELYSQEEGGIVPEAALRASLGCGNPTALAKLNPGDVVLDLGSGGGIDCFLAAREVGPAGRAIGVDMTAAMIERARALAAKLGAGNVEFRLGEIEHLPVADETVDCIISNCVVNLSPDKLQVFREALRVLRPGGRLVVSDLVLTRELSPELRRNVALYVGCVAGATSEAVYLQLLRDAGFANVEVLERSGYSVGTSGLAEDSPEREAFASVVSLKVRAVRA